jgi:hypothetical protein
MQTLAATTENMSRGDILVLIAADQANGSVPCVGDPLIVEIDLPANHTFGRKCMQCQTTVVRIDKSQDGAARLALRIHKMRFQSCLEFPGSDAQTADSLSQLVM